MKLLDSTISARSRKKRFLFSTLTPISWGKGTEKTSEDTDRILADEFDERIKDMMRK